jgi:hypothetical protein
MTISKSISSKFGDFGQKNSEKSCVQRIFFPLRSGKNLPEKHYSTYEILFFIISLETEFYN